MTRKWPKPISVTVRLSMKPRKGIEALGVRLDRLVAARVAADMDQGIPQEEAQKRNTRAKVIREALVWWLRRRLPLEMSK